MHVPCITCPDDDLISNLKVLLLNHHVHDGAVLVDQDQEPVLQASALRLASLAIILLIATLITIVNFLAISTLLSQILNLIKLNPVELYIRTLIRYIPQ